MTPPLALHDLHRELGAVLRPFHGFDAPQHYGDEAGELDALHQSVGLLDRSWLDRLILTGTDRLRFLGGLVTCEVKSLEPGHGAFGFVTDIKGRVLADLAVLAMEDTLALALPPGLGAMIAKHLLKYRIADQVDALAVEQPVTLTFCGPRAEPMLTAVTGSPLPVTPWSHIPLTAFGGAGRLVRDPRFGRIPAWSLWLDDADTARRTVTELLAAGRPHGLLPVGWRAADVLRIEEGRPRFGQDFDHGHFPQESGLGDEAVSFTKGCFLGQEIIARIHYRGGVQRRLVGLRFADPKVDATGKALGLDGRAVGTVSSWATSPRQGAIGLAVVHRRAEDAATVEVEGGSTAVIGPLHTG